MSSLKTGQAAPPRQPVVRLTPSLRFNNLAKGGDAELLLRVHIARPYHVNANPASESYLIPLTVQVADKGVTPLTPIYPAGVPRKFVFTSRPIAVYEDAIEVRVPLRLAAGARSTPALRGRVRYQACDEKSCLLPVTLAFSLASDSTPAPAGQLSTSHSDGAASLATSLRRRYNVQGLPAVVFVDGNGRERADLRAGEELLREGPNGFVQRLAALQSGRLWTAEPSATNWLQKLQSASLLSQLALVFLGGLLLNLTPCVYPLIPITVGFFGAQSEGNVTRRAWLALLYVLGLALVYSSLGVVASLTGRLFGAALQSPWVPALLAIVLALLAFSMLGFFTLQPPRFLLQKSGARRGAWGAFGMGALLGFVAAPCVGPVVVALLTYVGSKANPVLGFLLFFALSLGLGAPYVLLGIFSGAIKNLPRSGAWMERLKKIFAVPLLLAAFYYGWLALHGFTARPAAVHWQPATAARLFDARRAGQPVVLDFRADWCLPCLQLENKIFSQAEVLAWQNRVELLQVDLTRDGA